MTVWNKNKNDRFSIIYGVDHMTVDREPANTYVAT